MSTVEYNKNTLKYPSLEINNKEVFVILFLLNIQNIFSINVLKPDAINKKIFLRKHETNFASVMVPIYAH